MSLQACFLVLLGGFCGGIARFSISGFIGRRIGETFPWALSSLTSLAPVVGLLAGAARNAAGIYAQDSFREFAAVGLCGGYTTVSSFCLQTLNLGSTVRVSVRE
jgi:CrcB protein